MNSLQIVNLIIKNINDKNAYIKSTKSKCLFNITYHDSIRIKFEYNKIPFAITIISYIDCVHIRL